MRHSRFLDISKTVENIGNDRGFLSDYGIKFGYTKAEKLFLHFTWIQKFIRVGGRLLAIRETANYEESLRNLSTSTISRKREGKICWSGEEVRGKIIPFSTFDSTLDPLVRIPEDTNGSARNQFSFC